MIEDVENKGGIVRFVSLEIENFGCVKKGKISMDNDSYDKSNVLGLYGQNGSGKSTFIRAMALLRLLLCGAHITDVQDYITAGENWMSLKADFNVFAGVNKKSMTYFIKIHAINPMQNNGQKWRVSEEEINLYDIDNLKGKTSLVFVRDNPVSLVQPATVKKMLSSYIEKKSGITKDIAAQLFFLRQQDKSDFYGASFIFGEDMISLYKSFAAESKNDSIIDYLPVIQEYAKNFLFVITDSFWKESSRNEVLPIIFPNQKIWENEAINYFPVNLNKPTFSKEEVQGDFLGLIDRLNSFIATVAPGTRLLAEVNRNVLEKPDGTFYDVYTVKDDKIIPIRFESAGIKRLLSIIGILVMAYGNGSVMLCIDEMDSSIHDHVLEVFFKLFLESGKGQIFFASNNQHLMEILDKSQCWLTTTKPSDRYTRLKYVKPNNNLHSLYMTLVEKGGDEKNPDLFNPLDVEGMKKVFDEAFGK